MSRVQMSAIAMLVISAIALVVQHQAAADDPPKTSRYYRQRAAEAYKAKDYSTAIENLKKAASGWILQAQPANEGGWNASLNPTHGSGWIVQAQPTNEGGWNALFEYHPRQWVDRSSPACKRRRLERFV